MTIAIGILAVLLSVVSAILWVDKDDLKSMESSRDYFRDGCYSASRDANKWKNLHDKELSRVQMLEQEIQLVTAQELRTSGLYFEKRQEVAALEKQLKELTPETPQKPWWTEED